MVKDPAFLFYPGDYLRDVQCLSPASQVVYDKIMCEHMRNICIRQNQLQTFMKGLSESDMEDLMVVLEQVEGGYQIPWVAASITKRRLYSESRRQNRTKKGCRTYDNHMKTYDEHMENENVIENIIEEKGKKKGGVGEKGKEKEGLDLEAGFPKFSDIWEAYGLKVGRKAAENAYRRLTANDRSLAYTKIPLYIKSLSDRKFQAHLSTWLNGRRWEDEYPPVVLNGKNEGHHQNAVQQHNRHKTLKNGVWGYWDQENDELPFGG